MVHWIFKGVIVVGLAVITYGAPQSQKAVTPQQPQWVVSSTGNNPASLNDKPSAYKNGSRDAVNGTSELFGYPEDPSAIESKQNARNRTPVYIPNRCQQNEILYPGDQESDWVCDCKPTFVYHPPTRQCYQLYTQAYCDAGQMVTLEAGAKHPQCVPNGCYRPNATWVRFQNECVQLNMYYEKCESQGVKLVVSVREEDNKLGCINISAVDNQKLQTPDQEMQGKGSNANRGAAQRSRQQS